MRKRRTIIRDPLTGRRRVATRGEERLIRDVEGSKKALKDHIAYMDEKMQELQAEFAKAEEEKDIRQAIIDKVSETLSPQLRPHLECFLEKQERVKRKPFVEEFRDTHDLGTRSFLRITVRVPEIFFCYDKEIFK